MEQTECFETSAYKIQAPGNYPEENIQYIYLFIYLVMMCFICHNTEAISLLYHLSIQNFRKKTSFSTKPPSVAITGTREPPQPGGLSGTPAASCLRKKSSSSIENQDSSATNRIPSVVKEISYHDLWSSYQDIFIWFSY